ncbi:hypothetical protein CYMTET_52565 [Cymbomonas tetramitiformis]|uniref:F-box domain-containing protein n=1 Tax=Cymbomonas tetramitiformis TaxID=36881 RepID=A0AAE0ER78_9CHLO|nr:hypothetical protein CYMTET_52565 [Cymbomonas tetramitiformis]
MDYIAGDVLCKIFRFLSPRERHAAVLVCRLWRDYALADTFSLVLELSPKVHRALLRIDRDYGHQGLEEPIISTDCTMLELAAYENVGRVSGHLAPLSVMGVEARASDNLEISLSIEKLDGGAERALCLVEVRAGVLKTLDLSRSMIAKVPLGNHALGISLQCRSLTALSLAGSRKLAFAQIPASLEALSLTNCPELSKLSVVSARAPVEGRLAQPAFTPTYINLGGCRRLSPASFEQVFCTSSPCNAAGRIDLSGVLQLDLSWLHQLSSDLLWRVVRRCSSLKSLAMRGVADNHIVSTLAEATTLEAVDLAFSAAICGSEVTKLMDENITIVRCNLRGCKTISRDVYNAIAQQAYHRLNSSQIQLPSPFYYLTKRLKGEK